VHEIHRWVFPDTTVSKLLAIRPLALSILEKHGMDPFTLPLAKVGDLCGEKRISWDVFMAEMLALEVPGPDSDWSALPLYFLLDYLTDEHREFNREFLPAIKGAFSALEKSGAAPERFAALIGEWRAFAISLNEHIATEESFLFQKILRYDYCVRHGKIDPDFFRGSVRVFAALQLHKNEQHLLEIIRNFLDVTRLSIPVIGEDQGAENTLMRLLESFDGRHQQHSRIEKDVLVPMASAMEKKLYDRFISGESSGPHGPVAPVRIPKANEPY
jgi:iron-sulfur cluster repair protein YtfE (RIC family)